MDTKLDEGVALLQDLSKEDLIAIIVDVKVVAITDLKISIIIEPAKKSPYFLLINTEIINFHGKIMT